MGSVLRVQRLWLALAAMLSAMTVLTVDMTSAVAAQKVAVNIVVVEATRSGKAFDAQVKRLKLEKKLQQYGFTSAKVMDSLRTNIELQSSVSLEILSKSGKARTLTVKVLQASAKTGTVKLSVAVPESKFKTETTHEKGGTLMLALPPEKAKRVFLVVTPKP